MFICCLHYVLFHYFLFIFITIDYFLFTFYVDNGTTIMLFLNALYFLFKQFSTTQGKVSLEIRCPLIISTPYSLFTKHFLTAIISCCHSPFTQYFLKVLFNVSFTFKSNNQDFSFFCSIPFKSNNRYFTFFFWSVLLRVIDVSLSLFIQYLQKQESIFPIPYSLTNVWKQESVFLLLSTNTL